MKEGCLFPQGCCKVLFLKTMWNHWCRRKWLYNVILLQQCLQGWSAVRWKNKHALIRQKYWFLGIMTNYLFWMIFVKPACGELDMVATTALQCMCICASILSDLQIFPDHNFYILGWISHNLAQLFALISRRCAIWRFHSGRSKVKVMQAWRVVPGQHSSFSNLYNYLLYLKF